MKQHRHSILQGFHELFASDHPGYEISYPWRTWVQRIWTSFADTESTSVLVAALSDTLETGATPEAFTSGEDSLLKDHAEHIFNISALAFAGDLG